MVPASPQFFKADGSDDGAEFLVNANSAGDQDSVTLAVLTNGDVVLAWKYASGTLGDGDGTPRLSSSM